ncbi:MAG: hypothetical protein HRU50_15805 [Winogradskyella sp.]|uniref:hypothetical protein n=1 Tax=Winogradskyella sp. TaxID=1883156 RepID=UPI0025CDE65F|nr:hypothetical protein [Winogradskyella sp.]NRB61385.1 hypothetical protein [Winogradskyella sp.]
MYDFLIDRFHSAVYHPKTIFKASFERKRFGKSDNQIHELALKKFDEIYQQIIYIDDSLDHDPFSVLSRQKLNYLELLGENRILIDHYIIGDKDFFNRDLYEESDLLIEIMEFEGQLQNLIDLNRTYKFSVDKYFSPLSKTDQLYRELKDCIEVNHANFIDEYICNIQEYYPAKVYIIYSFLKKILNLKIKEEQFRTAVNNIYNLELKRLKKNSSVNYEYDSQLEKLKNKWTELNS